MELSRELETQVKKDPARFAHLIHRMLYDANDNYFEAILRGLAKPDFDIDMELVVSACLRCDKIPSRPLGRWITQPLTRFPDSILPNGGAGVDRVVCDGSHGPRPYVCLVDHNLYCWWPTATSI